ncbi:hypothetical protein GCM10009840_17860 [Pseudolysinimonas kribbensis]|uniref:Major tail protein n=1 Tax=Pseudolysinimonas kribbensis TaxID=433641 RepID=A0ABQ6K1M8_9MICO|nr:hypothetical protein [Pseudolysinimonas kribbensis]GMA93832.1 hypothetical protein GCM10025881_06560 [Pseudolysinimonas kribbensis]
MGSTRIKGTKLKLTIGTPGVDYWGDLSSWKISNDDADKDVTTFEDAAAGGSKQFKLTGTAIQSTASGSFWRYVWENTGVDAAFTIAPHGNETATADQPHVIGTLTIGAKPDLGGDAGNGAYTFDFEFLVVGTPTLDSGSEE